MRFTKMHGLGNDYVYVDCVNGPMPVDPAELSIKVSDRHFGIGSDGLILICPSLVADARMRMFNADGSESEMCGNGLRCVAKYVHDHGIAKQPTLKIETGRGVLSVDLEVVDGKVERVTVNMGEPILDAEKIPTTLPGNPPVNAEFNVDDTGLSFVGTCVSMGNPPAVVPVPSVAALGELTTTRLDLNVEYVEDLGPAEIAMRVHERGVGETRSCGTGACAAVVATALRTGTARGTAYDVHVPGGRLVVTWREDGHVVLAGPAVLLAEGVVHL